MNIHRVDGGGVTEAEEVLGSRTDTMDGGLGATHDPSCGEQEETEAPVRQDLASLSTRTHHRLSEPRSVAACKHVLFFMST